MSELLSRVRKVIGIVVRVETEPVDSVWVRYSRRRFKEVDTLEEVWTKQYNAYVWETCKTTGMPEDPGISSRAWETVKDSRERFYSAKAAFSITPAEQKRWLILLDRFSFSMDPNYLSPHSNFSR